MGFFDFIMGKPMPQSDERPDEVAQPPETEAQRNGLVDEHGVKIVPTFKLDHVKSHRNDNKLTVTAWVTNNSDQRIRIDWCEMLRHKQQFDRELDPGQGHELTLYEGEIPHDEAEHHAQFVYRSSQNGDLFQRMYRIEYHLEGDEMRTVDNLFEDGPVRDI